MEGNTGTAPSNDNPNNNNATSLINVAVTPSKQKALRGVVNTIDFLFTIKTGKKDGVKERAPCDVAFVLDRSGSMQGVKLENCKATVAEMVSSLTDKDRIHLVAYDDRAEVIFEQGNPEQDKETLLQKIQSVHDQGCTNLYEGIEVGGKLLSKHKAEGRSRSLFVFSDGLANRGRSSKEEVFGLVRDVHREGVTISSYGIGADFDENMMKGIQEHGTGDYYFIESGEDVSRLVNLGFSSLLSALGNDAVFKVRGKNGGVLRKIYAHPDLVKGAQLGNLKSGNTTQILARLDITPPEVASAEVVTWELSYIPEGEKSATSITGSFTIQFTDDDKDVDAEKPNQQVYVMLVIQEVIETYTEVLRLIDCHNVKAAVALQEQSVQKLRDVLPLDTTGIVERMLKSKEKGLTDLKTKDVKVARKKMHKERYEDTRMDEFAYDEHD